MRNITLEGMKTLVGNSFKQLRSKGFIARQGYLCCMSCASSNIYSYWKKMKNRSSKRGAVYYHAQDRDSFNHRGVLWLRFSSLSDKDEESDAAMKSVGAQIVEVLRANGLHPNWNGDRGTCIEVSLELERAAAEEFSPERYGLGLLVL